MPLGRAFRLNRDIGLALWFRQSCCCLTKPSLMLFNLTKTHGLGLQGPGPRHQILGPGHQARRLNLKVPWQSPKIHEPDFLPSEAAWPPNPSGLLFSSESRFNFSNGLEQQGISIFLLGHLFLVKLGLSLMQKNLLLHIFSMSYCKLNWDERFSFRNEEFFCDTY